MGHDNQKVHVVVRSRPKLDILREKYELECLKKLDDERLVLQQVIPEMINDPPKSYAFQFDRVYDKDSTQEEIYFDSCIDLVDYALQGYDVTILTYGQTGSGKTHTVLGKVGNVKSGEIVVKESGLFLRILQDLFQYKKQNQNLDVKINVSMMEIYLENFRDLLAGDEPSKVTLRETDQQVYIQNLKHVQVSNSEQVYKLYKQAEKNRAVASTGMNDVSSRSHAMFFLDLEQTDKNNPDVIMENRICLVDLAGSERVKKSDVSGIHMKEAQSINKSLSALLNVVNGLYNGKKHIPFRDSKLTRILKPSLVGKGKVLLIANTSPTLSSMNETLSTLRFANRVKEMKAPDIGVDALDAKLEQDFLKLSKENEKMRYTLKLATNVFEYKPLTRVTLFPVIDEKVFSKYINDITEIVKRKTKEELNSMNRKKQEHESKTKVMEEEKVAIYQEKFSSQERILENLEKSFQDQKNESEKKKESILSALESKKKEVNILENEFENLSKKKEELTQGASKLEAERTDIAERIRHYEERLKSELLESENLLQNDINDYKKMESYVMNEKAMLEDFAALREKLLTYRETVLKQQQARKEIIWMKDETDRIEISLFVKKVMALVIIHSMEDAIHSTPTPTIDNQEDDEIEFTQRDDESSTASPSLDIVGSDGIPKWVYDILKNSYPYDKPDITAHILHYLKSGSTLVKHCSMSKPHARHFFISSDEEYICWRDPDVDDDRLEKDASSYISLSAVKSITLGQCTKIFKRYPQTKDFYLSLSLHCSKAKKTLDFVAKNTFDFEAWTLGLVHLTGKAPIWGSKLQDIGDSASLTNEEVNICKDNHITANEFSNVKGILQTLKQKEKKVTRGQARVISNLDIFRSNAIYDYVFDNLDENASKSESSGTDFKGKSTQPPTGDYNKDGKDIESIG